MAEGPTISTHVLDTELGAPGVGVHISLYRVESGTAGLVGSGVTDDDGRIRRLLAENIVPGEYRLEAEIEGRFFHRVAITFVVNDGERSYHVPLLLSPYSLTIYRGS
jgi:5-hydroxyisourate hydrolase